MLRRLDNSLLRALRTRGHSPALERGAARLALAGEWGAVWVASGLAGAATDPRRRERWLAVAAVGPVAVGLNYVVKLAVRRPRPELEGLPRLGKAPSGLSFPSAHATSSFAAAGAISRVVPGAAGPAHALAGMISLTRAYLGMHYPSDVLAGVVLGAALGRLWPLPPEVAP